MYVISHSGGTWGSLGRGKNGGQIWPIQEYLVRTNHSPAVAERIERLNPNGKEEGEWPRGYHRSASTSLAAYTKRCYSISDFIRRFGREVFRSLPRQAFVKAGGKRRVISAQVVENVRASWWKELEAVH